VTTPESTPSIVLPIRGGAPPPLSWRSWPLMEPTLLGVLVAAGIGIAVVAAVVLTTGRSDLAMLALVVLALTAWRLWVPISFDVSAMGVTQHAFGRERRLPWQSIRHAQIGRRGVRLVATSRPGSPFTAIYVPTDSHHAEFVELLEYYLAPRVIERSDA
jgi:hypothetical protein